MQIRKSFSFEAAHVLPNHPGKCARMHGHSYRLEVALAGPLQSDGPAAGMIEDFATVSHVVKGTVIERLDHRLLNDVLDNPTAERIVAWIWEQLVRELPGLFSCTLWETRTACAVITKGDPETDPRTR